MEGNYNASLAAVAFATGAVSAATMLQLCCGAQKHPAWGLSPPLPPAFAAPPQLGHADGLDDAADPLRRVRKCEAVIQRRTSRIVVVL